MNKSNALHSKYHFEMRDCMFQHDLLSLFLNLLNFHGFEIYFESYFLIYHNCKPKQKLYIKIRNF